ncbi:MAG: phage tail tape measure protein [Hyphomicrobium zavarzinii]|jgi:phage-related minor tail protein|uniref:phage tail tape measure protein n=1 Tax=Hyphomicrobium zavarzinii TaxID=48292 RepID=UPI00036C9C70|nr:phage tail tape measure protein [Hyphomicrobium zavarzinii]MBL8844440.1 phage tail tape measure protein [Hyphomicrobium zavarzinii]
MVDFTSPVETWTVAVNADTSALSAELRNAASLGRQFSNALVGAFDSIAIKGRNVGDVLRTLALRLSDIVLKAALKPLEQGFGNLVSGLMSGGIGFAKGGVVRQGMPVPFASGGVIQSPISFPLAGGRLGIAGERGAEAIMPLSRGPDGRLGIAARGGAGTSVTFNVTAQDAESFRRSETQIAAMLARAVSLGQRNL